MRIAVCDDCKEDALSLKNLLNGHKVETYVDSYSLLWDMEKKGVLFDLYFLDIFMGESINGIELARKIKEMQEDALICFVSTSDGFYREAYDLYALQYLIKPVQEDALGKLMKKAERDFNKNKEQKLSFTSRGQIRSIPYKKILYIGSREHTVYIYCTDGKVQKYKGKLNELEGKLYGNIFLRCHQSYIVNIYHVDSLCGSDLMISGSCVPVSRRYYAEVKRRYQEVLFEEVD